MRLKPRKKKAARLSYRKSWKSCSTARTKVRLPLPFQQLSSALRSPFETTSTDHSAPSVLAWLFLGLRLCLRSRAITSCRWRTFPCHLGVARSHLGISRSHLWIMRHFVHRMGSISGTSGSRSFAGVRSGLVAGLHVVGLASGLKLVPVCATVACSRCFTGSFSLKITFGHVSRLVSTVSCCRVSDFVSALTLPRARALAIDFGRVPDFVFTFACTRSRRSPRSLFAALACRHAVVLIE